MSSRAVLGTLALLAMLTLTGCGGDSSRSTGPTVSRIRSRPRRMRPRRRRRPSARIP